MEKGISLYPGLSDGPEHVENFLEQAAQSGYNRLFCSFHIPETDPELFQQQMKKLLQKTAALHFKITGDLVPGKEIPAELTHLRLDDGFSPEAIAVLQKKYPEKIIVFNGSAVTENFLNACEKAGVDFSKTEALHNFYPHPHTGLAEKFFLKQNAMFHQRGIKVGAFIPSETGRRGPLYEGLPTLEKDRHKKAVLAMKHLAALGTDAVYFGDGNPPEKELKEAAGVNGDVVELTLLVPRFLTGIDDMVAGHVYETRPDEAEEVIRTVNSRALWKNHPVPPLQEGPCQKGTVTLDNDRYGRYKGELEICKTDLPGDKKVDVLGQIPEEELFLLDYLTGGRKFRFHVIIKH